jgi:hypothetical protein
MTTWTGSPGRARLAVGITVCRVGMTVLARDVGELVVRAEAAGVLDLCVRTLRTTYAMWR